MVIPFLLIPCTKFQLTVLTFTLERVGSDVALLFLDCQSGVWSRQPIPSAYSDAFDESGFSVGLNSCSGANVPQRTYNLALHKRSIVFMSLISGTGNGGATSGLAHNGTLCGYNAHANIPSWSTSSASCYLVLPAGNHSFNFCVNTGSSFIRGNILVLPNE